MPGLLTTTAAPRRLSCLASHLARTSAAVGPKYSPPGVTASAVAATVATAGPLTADQLQAFNDDGFVVVDGLLDTAVHIAPIQRALKRKVDAIAAALVQAGVISNAHAALPLGTQMEALARDVPGLAGAMHGDRSAVTAMQGLCELWRTPVLLDMVLRISIEMAAFSVLFSIEKAAISIEIRSKANVSSAIRCEFSRRMASFSVEYWLHFLLKNLHLL